LKVVALLVIAGVALLVALAALSSARKARQKIETLTQSYWELRYDFTRLRSQVARLDPVEQEDAAPAPPPGQVAFVPLSSMKKKNE
jgi:hypothetical protein